MHVCRSTGQHVPENMNGIWRARNHEHNQQITLKDGDIFPRCRLCGRGISWCYVHEELAKGGHQARTRNPS